MKFQGGAIGVFMKPAGFHDRSQNSNLYSRIEWCHNEKYCGIIILTFRKHLRDTKRTQLVDQEVKLLLNYYRQLLFVEMRKVNDLCLLYFLP